MFVSQPVPTKTTGFLLVLKSVSPSIFVGRCRQYASRTSCYFAFEIRQIGALYKSINLFIFVSKKSLNVK